MKLTLAILTDSDWVVSYSSGAGAPPLLGLHLQRVSSMRSDVAYVRPVLARVPVAV